MAVTAETIRKTTNDPLVVAGRTYSSRLLVGTGKYKDLEETRRAVELWYPITLPWTNWLPTTG